MNVRFWLVGLALVVLTAGGVARADEQAAETDSPKRAPIYDESAEAEQLVAAALKKAARDHQRVLLQFGGNWCGWCYKLHDVMSDNREVAAAVRGEYIVVPIDIGRFDKNMPLAEHYGAQLREHGVPFLTVLDHQGKVLVNQNTSDLEDGDHHDVAKVTAFLAKWKAEPRNAEVVMRDGLDRAAKENKRVLLHFGAPWCGWCHSLEDFLAEHEQLFEKDFVDIKIDMDRMTNAAEISQKYREGKGAGIPWFVILDAEGQPLVDSDGPEGNVGYPVQEPEIAHFMNMLRKTTTRLEPSDLEVIQTALETAAKKILEKRE